MGNSSFGAGMAAAFGNGWRGGRIATTKKGLLIAIPAAIAVAGISYIFGKISNKIEEKLDEQNKDNSKKD